MDFFLFLRKFASDFHELYSKEIHQTHIFSIFPGQPNKHPFSDPFSHFSLAMHSFGDSHILLQMWEIITEKLLIKKK